jgi:hypothetical protein
LCKADVIEDSKWGQQSTGRYRQAEKLSLVRLTEKLYPAQVNPQTCVVYRRQYVWRIINGQAKDVCYVIYALPDCPEQPLVPGVRNSRSEYGREIILMVAFYTK